MSTADLPKPVRTVLAVLSVISMGIAAYAYADGRVQAKIDHSIEPVSKQVDKVDQKMDRLIDLFLQERREHRHD